MGLFFEMDPFYTNEVVENYIYSIIYTVYTVYIYIFIYLFIYLCVCVCVYVYISIERKRERFIAKLLPFG